VLHPQTTPASIPARHTVPVLLVVQSEHAAPAKPQVVWAVRAVTQAPPLLQHAALHGWLGEHVATHCLRTLHDSPTGQSPGELQPPPSLAPDSPALSGPVSFPLSWLPSVPVSDPASPASFTVESLESVAASFGGAASVP
jgi:hypothetical protein